MSSESMTALWLEDRELRVRTDVPVPEPPAAEALVRVIKAGICNTDFELVRGYYPYRGILGHEFVGAVVAGPSDIMGKRVVGEINAVCHRCPACQQGRPTHCENRTVLGIVDRDGAFAEYLSLPVENLHPVPEGLTDDAAVFTEPLAAALQIQEQVEVHPDDRVLVVGDGKLGQLVAQTMALTGCDLLVTGRHSGKLARLSSLGIDTGVAETIAAGTFDFAVECTGNPDGFDLARKGLRPRGTLVMKSTYAGTLTFDAASLVVDEITLVGSRCGPFPPALRLLEEGKVQVEPLIDARYPLAEGLEAFERAQQPGMLKVLLEVADGAVN